jgi:hypothetical protein
VNTVENALKMGADGVSIHVNIGAESEARMLADELSGEMAKGLSPYSLAQVYFTIGDDKKGFELLERAYEIRDRYLGFMWIDFDLMRLREDPRFQALLEKTGMAGRVRN